MSEAHEEILKTEDHPQHDHHDSVPKESEGVPESIKSLSDSVKSLSLAEKSTNEEEEKSHHKEKEEEHHIKKSHESKKHEAPESEEPALHASSHDHSSSHDPIRPPAVDDQAEAEVADSHIEGEKEHHDHEGTHHTPELTQTHNPHDDPVHVHGEDPESTEKESENPEHGEAGYSKHPSTSDVYQTLLSLDIDEENEFLIPLHSKLKKVGKFHQTLLGNYLKISGDFISSDRLEVNGKELKVDKFNWTSRSLQVGKETLFFTGGNSSYSSAFVLNVTKGEVKEVAKLKNPRDLHTMAWVDGKVAVIGGCNENQNAIASVEVFDSGEWVEISPLNHARYGHSATFHLTETWVFAGAKSKGNPVQTIEVYQNQSWKVLRVKSPFQVVGAGIIGVKNSIFILGGFGVDKKNTSSVFKFNIKDESFEQDKDLDTPASFSQNLWRLEYETLEGFTFRGRKITYQP